MKSLWSHTSLQCLQVIVGVVVWAHSSQGQATAGPEIKTPSPVIYLTRNLDEKDNLGWCIDTLGRGFGERLQAHSCKPRGGDVQFQFDPETGLIRSVAYADFCMANRPDGQTTFGLETCDASIAEQQFTYDTESQEIRPSGGPDKCVVVGNSSKSAGPFMSRDLLLSDCGQTHVDYKQWVILD